MVKNTIFFSNKNDQEIVILNKVIDNEEGSIL